MALKQTLKIASLVGVLTVLSKILGLTRDLVIAHYFGTSMQADAFNLAYLLTGNFFIILGGIGGPFYSSIVATLPKLQNEKFKTNEFLKSILARLTLISAFVALALFLSKNFILKIFIDQELKPEYFEQTLLNIDILLPLILLTAPAGILFAVLNCYKRYFAPSLAPGVINIVLIATLFLMGDSFHGLAIAIGTSIGAVLSLVIQIPSAFGNKGNELVEMGKELISKYKNEFYILLVPALLSTTATQIMVFVDSYFCKYLEEGSWTAITIANRLIQMPLGVVMTAFLVPVFPKITEMIAQGRIDRIKEVLTKSLGFLFMLCIPGIAIAMFFSKEIISIIFERGAFNADSTALVAEVFFYLSLSAIPYIFRDSFTRTLYCFGDSKSPLYVMLIAMLLKVLLNLWLVGQIGIAGIAISTVLASAFNASTLFFIVRKNLNKTV